MQKIIPNLWFNDQAEEAANFYVSIFSPKEADSRIKSITRYDEASAKAAGRPEGSVLTVEFELGGQEFVSLNGGPEFKFSEAISFIVNCKTQEEVDYYWNKLCEGGEEGVCGWLKDKYGLSWQVVPTALSEMLSDKDAEKSKKVMEAMLQMKKIDIDKLKEAYDQSY